jgi:hypothetical protein
LEKLKGNVVPDMVDEQVRGTCRDLIGGFGFHDFERTDFVEHRANPLDY